MKLLGKASLLLLGIATVLLAGCGKEETKEQTTASTKTELKEVKVGLVGEYNEEWQYLQKTT